MKTITNQTSVQSAQESVEARGCSSTSKEFQRRTPVRRYARHLEEICFNSCQRLLAQIRRAKAEIVEEFSAGLHEHAHLLDLAVNEAEALAWQTGFPQLLFPTLA